MIELGSSARPTSRGAVHLAIDGELVGTGEIPRMLFMISSMGMDFGRSPRPVCPDYPPPFVYPGRIDSVVIELPPIPPELMRMAHKSQVHAVLARQ